MLQDAEDNYYLTAKYLLELAKRAYELFVSSEADEKRQLIKLVLQNLRMEGGLVKYDVLKPFDTILKCSDRQAWLGHRENNIPTAQLSHIFKIFEDFTFIQHLREEMDKVKFPSQQVFV